MFCIDDTWNALLVEFLLHRKVENTKMKTLTLTEDQVKLLADAIWMRQRCFIAGDKRFKEYGTMLEDILGDLDYTPSRY
jgi:hypothetical protein